MCEENIQENMIEMVIQNHIDEILQGNKSNMDINNSIY
jgi:hypothetical protein